MGQSRRPWSIMETALGLCHVFVLFVVLYEILENPFSADDTFNRLQIILADKMIDLNVYNFQIVNNNQIINLIYYSIIVCHSIVCHVIIVCHIIIACHIIDRTPNPYNAEIKTGPAPKGLKRRVCYIIKWQIGPFKYKSDNLS